MHGNERNQGEESGEAQQHARKEAWAGAWTVRGGQGDHDWVVVVVELVMEGGGDGDAETCSRGRLVRETMGGSTGWEVERKWLIVGRTEKG